MRQSLRLSHLLQVKTYTDHGNGIRPMGTAHYSKLSPGREYPDNMDMELQSQSQDCEPTPPLQRHGSKSNFFLPQMDMNSGGGGGNVPGPDESRQLRYSPYPKHRQMNPNRTMSPEQQPILGMPPQQDQPPQRSMQQRIKALGVATPIAISSPRRSNPGTPTQPRAARPDFIGVHTAPNVSNPNYYELQMQAQYQPQYVIAQQQGQPYHHQIYDPNGGVIVSQGYQFQAQQQQQQQQSGSPQRRYLSEGELIRQRNVELSYARTNTTDNIRELAGSPQKGVYVWKSTSPNYNLTPNEFPPPTSTASNNLMLRQQQQQQQQVMNNYVNVGGGKLPPVLQRLNTQSSHNSSIDSDQGGVGILPATSSGYHPALRGGIQVFPPNASPQIKRKTANTRPISFVRALEMADSMELQNAGQQTTNGQSNSNQQQSGGEFSV